MIFNIDGSAVPQTPNIDFEKDAHTAILLEDSSKYGAFSSQIGVWTNYVHICIISGAHVLKRALRKLSPRSFRQDFFSHKLVIALDCTQKKRFNFLFLHFLTDHHSTSSVQCPNLVMYISRPKYENITWLKWSVFVGIDSIHSSSSAHIFDKHQYFWHTSALPQWPIS